MLRRNKLLPIIKLTVVSGLAAALLSGCGIRGSLKVPPPVFGSGDVNPERVPTDDLDKKDEIDPTDLLDQEFGDPDPWMDKVASYIAIREEVTAADVLTHALELDPRNQGRREARRIADVLQTMGWRRLVTSRKDPVTGKSKSVRVWQRPKDDPLNEDHILNDF